ncbi:unnamed protein product [Linum tenue]|uniref:Secreted protein n=1 Tax=Linum tenue TaxID=586396 RepID=A0AAV0HTR9_9ROSI|nr:unnamed protein product [Linum tenue]
MRLSAAIPTLSVSLCCVNCPTAADRPWSQPLSKTSGLLQQHSRFSSLLSLRLRLVYRNFVGFLTPWKSGGHSEVSTSVMVNTLDDMEEHLAGASAFSSIVSFVLTLRIKPVYETLYAGGSFRLPRTSDDQ